MNRFTLETLFSGTSCVYCMNWKQVCCEPTLSVNWKVLRLMHGAAIMVFCWQTAHCSAIRSVDKKCRQKNNRQHYSIVPLQRSIKKLEDYPRLPAPYFSFSYKIKNSRFCFHSPERYCRLLIYSLIFWLALLQQMQHLQVLHNCTISLKKHGTARFVNSFPFRKPFCRKLFPVLPVKEHWHRLFVRNSAFHLQKCFPFAEKIHNVLP